MKKIIILLALLAFLPFRNQAQKITDYDGNVYDTVQIGTLVWLKPNLKTTHYSNGVSIPLVSDSIMWAHTWTGARCYYQNDSAAYDTVYGTLYNYFAVKDTNHICPAGWHVSTNEDWETTEAALGGMYVAGGKMKEAGTQHWLSPNEGATNSSGFTGLPGGCRDYATDAYRYILENGCWWTSTPYTSSTAWTTYMWYMFAGVDHNPINNKYALSIRCVKDYNLGIGEINNAGKIRLYPNPASDRITIELVKPEELTLHIYNILGEIVLQKVLTESTNDTDITTLPKGIYIIKVTSTAWTFTQKLVKD